MSKRWLVLAGIGMAFSMTCTRLAVASDTPRQQLANETCSALKQAAAAIPGDGPMILPSYPGMDGDDAAARALQNVGFVYDNALAGIALGVCGAPGQARRIADAFLLAPASDATYKDGRLRNAYRSGAVQGNKVMLPGYWQKQGNYWSQDPYQTGTASGNVAWAALLMLTVYDNTHDSRYLDGAVAQLKWIAAHTANATAPAGYEGGVFGYDHKQIVQHWKSTEHNIDIYAAATWANRERADPAVARQAQIAGAFVGAMWDGKQHRFFVGTGADGKTIERTKSGLDEEIWPLLAFQPHPAAWRSVWAFVDANHRFGDGYGFKRQPDGMWTEGTSQVAAALQASGKPVPDSLWGAISAQRSAGGMLYATPQARIVTSFAIGPLSTYDDFFYYHDPHLGATAWAALAAKGWNAFVGRTIAQPVSAGKP
ncbi:hypothetical protein [Dyella sp.]|uniref:hypothetical protein n=1 Tax=Dyella sp. TaxID=1869338 RepID=UPI002FDB0BA3